MVDQTSLLELAGVLAASTAVAAGAPLVMSPSPRVTSWITTVSSGILVGAALFVVIPEGVDQVYRAKAGKVAVGSTRTWVGVALLAGFILMYLIDSVHSHDQQDPNSGPIPVTINEPWLRSLPGPSRPPIRHRASLLLRTQNGLQDENEPLIPPMHSPTRTSHSPTTLSHPNQADYGTLPALLHTPGGQHDHHLESGQLLLVPAGCTNEPPGASSKLSIVIGLLAHSVADGLALGAAQLSSISSATPSLTSHDSSSSSPSLSLVVFFAILLHKFPTAFALSSLLARSSTRRFALLSLAAFVLAAPVAAVVAFNVLAWIGTGSASALDWWTGLGLVFSGGTFLFVATAVMKGGAEEEHGDDWKLTEKHKVALVILGMVIPAFLTELVHFIKH